MHILVIPSERLVPENNKLEGIFPYHQAVVLKEAGHQVGALSVDLSFSVVMILKGLLFKLIGKKAGNATDQYSLASLIKFGATKILTAGFITTEILEGVKVYRIDGLYRRPPVANHNHYSWIKTGLIGFKRYVKDNGMPDVVHAHEAIYAGMLAEKISARWKVPYVLTEHSTFYATGKVEEGIFGRVKKAYKKAAQLYAVSPLFAAFLNLMFAVTNFGYMPNVLDPQLEEAAYESYEEGSKSRKKFRFLNVALLKPVKDQKTLLNALKIVVDKNPDVELAIGGFGNLQSELEAQATDLGLQKHVRFLGELNREEVIREIKNADSFVLSSKYETFGVVLIEAMALGKPVVTTNVGVAPDIISEETGYAVEAEDERALAEAMLKLMGKQERFDPDYIRNFAIARFGKEAFVNRMNKIYNDVI